MDGFTRLSQGPGCFLYRLLIFGLANRGILVLFVRAQRYQHIENSTLMAGLRRGIEFQRSVIPRRRGTRSTGKPLSDWIPAFAGMTDVAASPLATRVRGHDEGTGLFFALCNPRCEKNEIYPKENVSHLPLNNGRPFAEARLLNFPAARLVLTAGQKRRVGLQSGRYRTRRCNRHHFLMIF